MTASAPAASPAHTPAPREGETAAAHPSLAWSDTDTQAVNVVRALAMDAVEQSGNGHPGTAMSLAPAAYLLFQRHLRHDPNDADWAGRDRFVLSCGHSSLTLYIQLYLSGYGLSLQDLQQLRQWGSLTPGHPEYRHTPGVETTTGPLGQGIATAVGMAMAARFERGLFDPDAAPGTSPFDHTIWVFASDGDMQEGVQAEAASLAGHQQLGNLVVLYDDNHISIEGDTALAFSEDVPARYEAYGWHVQRVDDAEDVQALHAALQAAQHVSDRPSLIAVRSVIAWPAPHARNTGKAHGAALGAAEVAATKENMGLDPDATFDVPGLVLAHTRNVAQRGAIEHQLWDQQFDDWARANPGRAEMFDRMRTRTLPEGWDDALPSFEAASSAEGKPAAMSTRKASGKTLAALTAAIPELWGGSADLAESNLTELPGTRSFLPASSTVKNSSPYGRTLHFGIREHAMGAVLNGIAVHGGTRPFGGTFLVFSDYMRPAVRLAALMQLPVIYVWTHDSIGLGEDGPTHQPIEHLWALRAIPGLDVVRPADANETAQAWKVALASADGATQPAHEVNPQHPGASTNPHRQVGTRPVGLCLTRQDVPVFERSDARWGSADLTVRGAYTLREAAGLAAGQLPKVLLLATGSEVQIALAAQDVLEQQGVAARVVSMPCLEWFDEQPQDYRDQVLPPSVRARVSVEAGSSLGWPHYVGEAGRSVSIDHYGASAPYQLLYEKFGLTAEAVVNAAQESLAAVG